MARNFEQLFKGNEFIDRKWRRIYRLLSVRFGRAVCKVPFAASGSICVSRPNLHPISKSPFHMSIQESNRFIAISD